MYRFQELSRFTLITPDEVIFHAATDEKPDHRMILQNIIVAEERFIVPLIGQAFYDALCNEKNKVVTSANKATLLAEMNAALSEEGIDPVPDLSDGQIINSASWLSVNNLELWNYLLWKLVAECVDVALIPASWLRHTAQGQQKNNPDTISNNGGSVTGDRNDIKYKIDSAIFSKIDPLTEALKRYLHGNKTKYPLSRHFADLGPNEVSVLRKSQWIFGAYDEPEKKCCKIK